MKEVPIIMTGDEVRAVLAGLKTQARRPIDMRGIRYIGPSGFGDDPDCWGFEHPDSGVWYVLGRGHRSSDQGESNSIASPYGQPGDLLYVRETWAAADRMYQSHETDPPGVVAYKADRSAIQWDAAPPRRVPAWDTGQWNWDALHWRSPVIMGKKSARIWLRVTDMWAERWQAMTEESARLEGFIGVMCNRIGPNFGREMGALKDYARAWDKRYAKRGYPYESNPWAWVPTFEIHELKGRLCQKAR